jgi:hypothetical protein
MAELNSWDITAANNNDAPPDGWPESTMQYSEVNNTAREGMAVIARFWKDLNGSLQFAGSVNAYTVTLNAGYTAYFQGMYFAAEINITNTSAVTINVNALGVKTVVDQAGGALTAGTLIAGGIYEFRYDGTNFQLIASTLGDNSITTAMITDGAVTLAKMADMATDSFIGRDTAGTGVPEVLSAATARAVLNVEDGSTADQTSIVGITGTMAEFDTAVTDGNIAYAGGAYHDGFSDFVAAEHIDWSVTGAEDVHADRVPLATESAVGGLEVATQSEADFGVVDNKIITPVKLFNIPVIGDVQFLQKAVATSRSNTTVTSDDPHLVGFDIDANTNYIFEGHLVYDENGGDLKLFWQFSDGANDFRITYLYFDQADTNKRAQSDNHTVNHSLTGLTGGQDVNVIIKGYIEKQTTAATLDLQWAQVISSANATTLQKNSWLKFTKVS